jgi:hypothetical protein
MSISALSLRRLCRALRKLGTPSLVVYALDMGLFNRRPRDLAETIATEKKKAAADRQWDNKKQVKNQAKHARKGAEKLAKTLSLKDTRPFDPASIQASALLFGVPSRAALVGLEGDLMVDGQKVTLQLLSDARIQYLTFVRKEFQDRTVNVFVLHNGKNLGNARFVSSNNSLKDDQESYVVAGRSFPDGKVEFLASLQDQLKGAPAVTAEPVDLPTTPAPSLSELEIVAAPVAPAAQDTSLEL